MTPMDSNGFGSYVKSLRRSKNITLCEITKAVGISHPYLSQIETGDRHIPSPEIIRKLSKALGCTHIGMMIKAGHVTEEEVFGFIHQAKEGEELKTESFGDFFRRLRRSKGFKDQKQLAKASGISQATLSRIEDGIQNPQEETLKILSIALDFPYENMLRKARGV